MVSGLGVVLDGIDSCTLSFFLLLRTSYQPVGNKIKSNIGTSEDKCRHCYVKDTQSQYVASQRIMEVLGPFF